MLGPIRYNSIWVYLALAEFFYALFYFSMPINNNFDANRYFSFFVFVPTLVVFIGIILSLKYFESSLVRLIIGTALTVVLILFGALSVQTESLYADHLMFIAGYEIIYYDELFSIILALTISMCYLELRHLIQSSIHTLNNEIIICVVRNIAISLLISGILLWIADSFGLGIALYLLVSCLLLSNMYGYFITVKMKHGITDQVDLPTPDGALDSENFKNAQKSPFLIKLLFSFFALLLSFLFTYLFYMDFVGYGEFGGEEGFWLARINERLVLQEFIDGFLFLGGSGVILIKNNSIMERMKKQKNQARGLGISIFIMAMAWWVALNLGTTFLFIRPSTYFAPILMILLFLWLLSANLQNRSTIGGKLGFLAFFFLLGSWAGMILIGESIDGLDYIVPGSLVFFIIAILLNNKITNNKKIQSADNNPQSGAPIKNLIGFDFMQKWFRVSEHRRFGVGLLIGIIILPSLLFISIPTFGSSHQFKLLAKVDNSAIFYLTNPYTRIDNNYQPVFSATDYQNPEPSIDLFLAKNEYETTQIVMKPINQKHFSIYSAEFSDFIHQSKSTSIIAKGNMSIFRVREVEALSGMVMDILEPFASFAIADGSNAPLWIRIYAPATAEAGNYKGTLRLTVDNKEQDWSLNPKSVEFNITLHVYNFTLPQTPSLKSNFGFYTTRPEFSEMMQIFQRNRMMHWSFIRAPTFTIAANGSILEMNFSNTNTDISLAHSYGTRTLGIHADFFKHIIENSTFEIAGSMYTPASYWTSNTSIATLAKYFIRIKEYYQNITYIDEHGKNRSFFEEIYLNGYDEIDGVGGQYKIMALKDYERFIEANCTLPIMQTVGGYYADTFSTLERFPAGAIICWHTTGIEEPHIKEWKAKGRDIWIYTTRGPRFPNPTIATSAMLLQVRALAWQCFVFNYTHYLIWDTATPNNANQGHGYQGWSGGTIFYNKPGGGYYESIRSELIREGFEDYEYFTLLQKTADSPEKRVLMNRVQNLFPNQPYFTVNMDYQMYEALRNDIALNLD